MDEFDRATHDRLTALERYASQRDHDVATLLTALAVHEGGDVAEVSFRRLGRHQDLTALWGDDPHPPPPKETPWLGL